MSQEFRMRRDGSMGTDFQVIAGILIALISLGSILLIGRGGAGLGVGILMLIVGIINKNRPIIILHDDHFEMKVAPLSPHYKILYCDINDLDDSGGIKNTFLSVGTKRIRLPLAYLTPDDQTELIDQLKKAIINKKLT